MKCSCCGSEITPIDGHCSVCGAPVLEEIDYENVDEIVSEFRNMSLNFLKEELELANGKR